MSTYLQTDFLNEPFKLEIIKKIKLSKTLSGADKSRLKDIIGKSNFIKHLKLHFNKSVYNSNDIEAVIAYLKGDN